MAKYTEPKVMTLRLDMPFKGTGDALGFSEAKADDPAITRDTDARKLLALLVKLASEKKLPVNRWSVWFTDWDKDTVKPYLHTKDGNFYKSDAFVEKATAALKAKVPCSITRARWGNLKLTVGDTGKGQTKQKPRKTVDLSEFDL